EEEIKFLHDLELYKDSAIIVINKPPGMPVQGGIGIKRSLDELAGTYMRHNFSEPPRLFQYHSAVVNIFNSVGRLKQTVVKLGYFLLTSIFQPIILGKLTL
nr:RNA pseudouridine synthase 4, mitochondrial [Tanacetum cinerariifolium]